MWIYRICRFLGDGHRQLEGSAGSKARSAPAEQFANRRSLFKQRRVVQNPGILHISTGKGWDGDREGWGGWIGRERHRGVRWAGGGGGGGDKHQEVKKRMYRGEGERVEKGVCGRTG